MYQEEVMNFYAQREGLFFSCVHIGNEKERNLTQNREWGVGGRLGGLIKRDSRVLLLSIL
jgi:hypothetical protein